jgi:hypothetical protein
VTVFDCLHDMGDPGGCAAHVKDMLKPDGTWMICEPIAADNPQDNVGNPVSRLYYNASTMICVPTSLDQEVGEALGAQAGEAKITGILKQAGFNNVRRATDGPFNMILEARSYCCFNADRSAIARSPPYGRNNPCSQKLSTGHAQAYCTGGQGIFLLDIVEHIVNIMHMLFIL